MVKHYLHHMCQGEYETRGPWNLAPRVGDNVPALSCTAQYRCLTCFHVTTDACADPKRGSTIHAARANYRSVAVADSAAAAFVVEAAAAAAAVAANSRRVLARARVPSARRAEADAAETAAQAGSSGLVSLSKQAALAKRRAAAQSEARRGKRPYGRK